MRIRRSVATLGLTALGLLALGACGATPEVASGSGSGTAPSIVSPTTPASPVPGPAGTQPAPAHAAAPTKQHVGGAATPANPASVPIGATTPAATAITTRIIGMPDKLAAGSTTDFDVLLTNQTKVDYPAVAPVFVEVGGPTNATLGTLWRFDETANAWDPVQMPGQGDDVTAAANNAFALDAGASETVHYRLTLSREQIQGQAAAVVYTVYLPARVQVGLANEAQQIVNS